MINRADNYVTCSQWNAIMQVKQYINYSTEMRLPAMHAVRKHAMDPATNALAATRARSGRRLGAIVDSAAIFIVQTDSGKRTFS